MSSELSPGCKEFKIIDKVWNRKKIGDILHFDYIGKYRFHKEKKGTKLTYSADYQPKWKETKSHTYSSESTTINLNSLEVDRRIMAIDREILGLERERDALIDSQ